MKIPRDKFIGIGQLRAELQDVITYFDFAETFVRPDDYSCEVDMCCQAIVNACRVCMCVLNFELNESEENISE